MISLYCVGRCVGQVSQLIIKSSVLFIYFYFYFKTKKRCLWSNNYESYFSFTISFQQRIWQRCGSFTFF